MIALNAGKGGKTWSVLGLNASLTSLPFIIKDKSTQNRKKTKLSKKLFTKSCTDITTL